MLSAFSLVLLMIWPIGLYVDSAPYLAEVSQAFEFDVIEDVRYYDGPSAHERKHLLDIYAPSSASSTPVIFFVHGGSWEDGDKSLYSYLGENFASRGFTTVVTNYRLSPAVRHPAHIEDVARGFAWVFEHIDEFGGDPDEIFIVGHSAGGHLVSLLALDKRYLAAHDLSPEIISGVVSVSGVYDLTIYPSVFFLDTFDPDDESRAEASPINHIGDDQPPFLVLYAQFDYPTLADQAEDFSSLLENAGTGVDLFEIPAQSHISIVISLGQDEAETTRHMLEFFAANR